MALILVLGMLPVTALAAEDAENTRTVYLTVTLNDALVKDKDGQLMAQRKLIVPTNNEDICTIDEIMRYAHEQFSPNGADDYASDGAKATKLWGTEKGENVILFSTYAVMGKSMTENVTFGSGPMDFMAFNPSLKLTASIYTDTASAYAARMGVAATGQGPGSATHAATAVILKDTAFPIQLIYASSANYSKLTGYQAVAYTMDGTPVGSDKFEGTVSAAKGRNAELSFKFSEPGTYVLSAVKTDAAKITASPPACLVTVLDKPLEYREFKLYADQARTQPLNVTESHASGETTTYTVAVPEDVNTLYPSFSLAEPMESIGGKCAYMKNGVWTSGGTFNFGSGFLGLLTDGNLTRQLRINIVNSWNTNESIQYNTLLIKTLPALDSLTVEGYEKDSFDPKGSSPYTLYIRADQSSVDITPVAKDSACVVTVDGVTGTSGQKFTVPVSKLSFDENNRAQVKVGVHAEGEEYVDNSYTIVLEKQPQDDTPTILMQPQGADYIVGKTAKALSIYASANGPLSYQWYRSATDSNTDEEPIEGATDALYTPSTAEAATYYYYCVVTNTQASTSAASHAVRIAVDNPINIDISWDVTVPDVAPEHSELFDGKTKGFYYRQGDKNVTPLQFKATCDDAVEGGTWSYNWSIHKGTSGLSCSTKQPTYTPDTDEAYGLCQFYCTAQYTNAKGVHYESNLYDNPIYVYVDKPTIDYSAVNAVLSGTGTAEDPWQLKDQADLTRVHDFVAQGLPFENRHFAMTQDITLDATWDSIGALKTGRTSTDNGKNINPFSATLDGGGCTLTYAEGTSKPLFRYVREAAVRNMNILAPNFKGALLVSDYVVDYGSDGVYGIGQGGSYKAGCPDTIDIDKITVKSGTWMSGGTFIDGGASGGNIVNIRNCVIEPGVTMGKDKDTGKLAGNIASFAGRISGTVVNCVSYADLYSSGGASGIVSGKCQSMGPYLVINCGFLGSITAGDGYVGGIIGFMYSLNKNNVIENNFYIADCGAQRAVGGAEYVDTSSSHETSLGISYFSTEGGKSANLPPVDGHDPAPKTDMNRTDDPFGKDAIKLGKPVTQTELSNGSVTAQLNKGEGSLKNWVQGESYPALSDTPVAYQLEISGTYKTEYTIGDALDMSGAQFTATWSDGSVTKPELSDIKFTGFDSSRRAVITLTASYGAAETQFAVMVLKKVTPGPGTKDTITVSFILLGDDHHDSVADGKAHTLRGGGLTTWIEEKSYEVDINATVETVFRKALGEAGIEWAGTANNQFKTLYISGVQNPVTKEILSEFDNGPLSGWMYTLNGSHPDVGIAAKFVEDGDRIIFHYTDDYTKEEGSEGWSDSTSGTSGGNSTVTPKATASNGKASVDLGLSDIKEAIASAKTSGEAIVIAPEITGTAKNVTVSLQKDAISVVAKQTESDITVKTPVGSVTLPNSALSSIISQAAGETVTVSLNTVDTSSLTETQKSAVGSSMVYDISVLSGNKHISSFDGSDITVSLPYTLKAGEDPTGVTVWYLNDSGVLRQMKCTYDKTTGMATFKTPHLSYYAVGYDKWDNPFTDIKQDDWFFGAVKYVSQKSLMSGTSSTSFEPDSNMTRAMLVTVLYRMEGKPAVSGTNSFTDVLSGQWYTDAVIWASTNKIVGGYGHGLFGTDDNVTREQMATILMNYAKYKKYDVTKTVSLTAYTDASSIDTWAVDALKWANAEGLISGTTATTLEPSATATRAQVATILMRFVEKFAK